MTSNMFTKSERSTFKYWFAHWCAFQMTALNLKAWRLKYLLHDIEKPWMLYYYIIFYKMTHKQVYKKVQKFHRTHSSHHIEYPKQKDYEALVIDWECSRFTKDSSPRTAYAEYLAQYGYLDYKDRDGIADALKKLQLWGHQNAL